MTFLLTLVIVDDVVALLVIALAYTDDLSPTAGRRRWPAQGRTA